jgi:hypothetical protein
MKFFLDDKGNAQLNVFPVGPRTAVQGTQHVVLPSSIEGGMMGVGIDPS